MARETHDRSQQHGQQEHGGLDSRTGSIRTQNSGTTAPKPSPFKAQKATIPQNQLVMSIPQQNTCVLDPTSVRTLTVQPRFARSRREPIAIRLTASPAKHFADDTACALLRSLAEQPLSQAARTPQLRVSGSSVHSRRIRQARCTKHFTVPHTSARLHAAYAAASSNSALLEAPPARALPEEQSSVQHEPG